MSENITRKSGHEVLNEMLGRVDLSTPPEFSIYPVTEDTKIVAVMSDDLKRIYVCAWESRNKFTKAVEAHNNEAIEHSATYHGEEGGIDEHSPLCQQFVMEMEKKREKVAQLDEEWVRWINFFWLEFYLEFPEYEGKDVIIHQGFQVALLNLEEQGIGQTLFLFPDQTSVEMQ